MLELRPSADFAPFDPDFEACHVHPSGIVPRNYHETLAAIRDTVGTAPAWFVKDLVPCHVITRFDDVRDAFGNHEVFSNELTAKHFTWPITGEQLMGYEGAKHIAFRKSVMHKFNKRAAAGYTEEIFRPRAGELVAAIARKGAECGGRLDLMHEFGHQFPMAIISDLLGLPTDDWDTMVAWAEKIILGGGDPQGQKRAADEFREFLQPIIEDRKANPRDDMLTALAQATLAEGGEPLTHAQVMGFMVLLFPAGVDTTWLTIGAMLAGVLSTPGAKERLVADPDLRHWAVEETLRWEPATPLIPRLTTRDIEVNGVTIPGNSLAVLALGAANREPGRFGATDPDTWDLDRKPEGHLAFSYGQHMCLGVHIARAELRVALDAMLEAFPRMELVEFPAFAGAAVRGPERVLVDLDPRRPG